MIASVFPYWCEREALLLRVVETARVVDRFVIAESDVTYDGKPKTTPILQHDEDPDLLDTIRRVIADTGRDPADALRFVWFPDSRVDWSRTPHQTTGESDRWQRENQLRDSLIEGLEDACSPVWAVVLSDADEVMCAEAISWCASQVAAAPGLVVRPALGMHLYDIHHRWRQPIPVINRVFSGATMTRGLETIRQEAGVAVWPHEDASQYGWHVCYLRDADGGWTGVRRKMLAAAHPEMIPHGPPDDDHFEACVRGEAELFHRLDQPYRFVEATPPSRLPESIRAGVLSEDMRVYTPRQAQARRD